MKAIKPVIKLVAVGVVFLGLAGTLSLHLLQPDLFGALYVRFTSPQDNRLIDLSGYRHLRPISSENSASQSVRYSPARESAQTPSALRLQAMTESTASNIVLLNRDGDILFEAYEALPDANEAMLTNSMSMAKTLVALLVGIAIDQGAIESVDQEIGDFLPEIRDDARGSITIEQLLQMESGLSSQDSGFPVTHLQAMYYGDSPHSRALSVPAVRPPGQTFDYNSVNTQLLLLIVERQLAASLEDLLSQHLWGPLDLDSAYSWRGSPDGDAKGFCCVFASARTWASIGQLLLNKLTENDDAIVSSAWVKAMATPSSLTQNYGYQVWLGQFGADNVSFISLEGSPQQLVIVFPTAGIVAVRVGNEAPEFSTEAFISLVLEFAEQDTSGRK